MRRWVGARCRRPHRGSASTCDGVSGLLGQVALLGVSINRRPQSLYLTLLNVRKSASVDRQRSALHVLDV